MKHIDGKLNREFLNPRFARLNELNRVGAFIVPEQKESSTHFHGAIRIPKLLDVLDKKQRAEETLRGLFPDVHVEIYRNDRWLRYMLKNVTRTTSLYVRGLRMNMP